MVGTERMFIKPGFEIAEASLAQILKATKETFVLIVDLRGTNAFHVGHIPHAVNIPVDHLTVYKARLNLASNVIIYSKADDAALVVAERSLAELGLIEKSAAFTGGWAQWSTCGLPSE